MTTRNRVTRLLLVAYALGSLAIAVPLILDVPSSVDAAGSTSGNVLAAALLALGVGAILAVPDPWQHRLVVKILIVFTTLATLAIVYRILTHAGKYDLDPAWMVLPVAASAPVLLAVFYPRPPQE